MRDQCIGRTILDKINTYGSSKAVQYKADTGWESLTYAQFGDKIMRLASALIQAGVNPKDRVGIYSSNRYEWALTDFACTFIGAISVPIYPTNTAEQARFIINDAEIKILFTDKAYQYDNICTIKPDLPDLKVVSFDSALTLDASFAQSFDTFIDIDTAPFEPQIRERADAVQPEDTLTIIYTSGTTGNPKGVMLTHNNVFHQFRAVDPKFRFAQGDISLCFLPLSHVFERVWSYFVFIKGAVNTYLEDPKQIIDTLQEVQPTAMVSVPRLYEKIYAKIMNGLETASPVKKTLFEKAIQNGDIYYNKLHHNEPIPFGVNLKHKILDKLVLSKIRAAVGGNVRYFIVGGAALEKTIEEFFLSCGLLICQGYGLTETSPIICFNTPDQFRFGTVGKPAPECEVRIGDHGEVQVKGLQVMKGYYNNPQKTAEVMDDGWFRTGDVGEFDKDGFLKITDRIKDLIITSGGKNIAPQRIETLVGKDFFIEQIVSIGEKRNYITALIVPSFENLETWAQNNGISYSSHEDLISKPEVIALYEERIQLNSKDLAQYETIKKFKLLPNVFSVETGEITPTMKVKRGNVNEKYNHLIEEMYS
ncbi:MAG: long-chain fatty acid--CoA ligase [Desulfobacteraceae bacterium]|nr:MAG: long-chain fatty acid--CoA ligase [Desulfobacteraceae bacterium]